MSSNDLDDPMWIKFVDLVNKHHDNLTPKEKYEKTIYCYTEWEHYHDYLDDVHLTGEGCLVTVSRLYHDICSQIDIPCHKNCEVCNEPDIKEPEDI